MSSNQRCVDSLIYNVSSNLHCANRTNSRGSRQDLCFNERSGLNARKSKLKPNDARERLLRRVLKSISGTNVPL